MIGALIALLPAGSAPRAARYAALAVLSVALRAAGAVLLVPLVASLFGGAPETAWPWVAWLAAVTLAGWGVDWAVARLGYELGFGLLHSGQRAVADHIERARLGWFTADRTAVARQAVAATGPELVGLIVYLITPLLSALLMPIALAVALLPISWQLGAAALLGVPVLLSAYWASGRLSRSADRSAAAANEALTERIIEFARTQQALRAARRAEPARSHAGAALESQHGAMVRLLLMQIPGQLVFGLATQLALLLLAGTTVWLAVSGRLTAPEAVALIVVIVRYLEPFTVLSELAGGVETTTGTLRRLREVLSAPAVPSGSALPETEGAPAIELSGVEFGYAEDAAPVIRDLDLRFEAGTTTAIVGPSGSGKSTILSLVAGLQSPQQGTVRIGGSPLDSLDADARRELVSVVFQHPYLFDGSLHENVVVGHPDADERDVRRSAALARVDGIVERLPGGWESRVGEAGGSLSGGERQRVSIARALVKPAPVLLVDEATSALDTENEAAIVAALTSDATPRTRIIVAHRLASIRAVDRVVFLEDGRVVEQGGVDELLAADGRFARFWRQQGAAAGWRLGATAE